MSDIVSIAIGEIGTRSSSKYISWYGGFGVGTPWCAIFVSWCANQAGVSTSIIPKYSSCAVGMQWFKSHNLFKEKGSYTPKRGDIVFFMNNRSHTGLVESVNGNTLHTVEGNTSNMVNRRSYSLSDSHITGYGTPQYASGSISDSSIQIDTPTHDDKSKKNNEKNVAKELEYLRNVLSKKSAKKVETVTGELEFKKQKYENIAIVVDNNKDKFEPVVKEGAKITLDRTGTPGQLTFSALFDSKYKIQEGNSVTVIVNGKKVFYGFVFTKKKSKENFIDYTVYDQLRYLKNKDTIFYTNKTASQLIKMLANKFQMRTGALEDTKYPLSKIEDDQTLFDMIQNSLDETLMIKSEMYVLYDDVGELTLKNIKNMKVNYVVDEETASDYSYQSSIDSNTYNQIKLAYENKETGKLETYISKSTKNINKWGVLQYFEKIDSPKLGKLKGKALLQMYNQKTRNLTIKNATGDIRIRAGSMIPVLLDLGDIKVANYMIVQKVTHTFNANEHKMDLTLFGGDFVA